MSQSGSNTNIYQRYLYLLLIIIITGVIIFLVYLSHEYRQPMIENFNINLNVQLDTNNNNLDTIDTIAQNKINNQETNSSNIINNIINYNNLENSKKQRNLKNETKKQFDLINNLTKQITNKSSSTSYPINKLIKTIKSNYNSQYLSLVPDQNMNKYGILVNDKCLTVNGLCKDELCTLECQNSKYSSDSQKFYTNRIYTLYDAARIMGTSPDNITTKNVYPFNIFRSASNDKCLAVNNDGVYLENCNLNNISHQWNISPDENICVMK
jgi:hypothetical protein